jgi:predicted secreted protein
MHAHEQGDKVTTAALFKQRTVARQMETLRIETAEKARKIRQLAGGVK